MKVIKFFPYEKKICLLFLLLGPGKTFGLENVRKSIQIIYSINILR